MSGEAVLNVLKSRPTRFAENFREFNWAALSDRASEACNRQGMHLVLIKYNVTSSDAKRPILQYIIKRIVEPFFSHLTLNDLSDKMYNPSN